MDATAAIQRRLIRTALSLPSPLLRAVSGGRAVYTGGRTLDPRFQLLMFAARQRARADVSEADGLALLRGGSEPGVDCQAVAIDGPRGPIHAQLHRPRAQGAARPMLVFVHVDCEASPPDPMQALCGMLAGAAGTAVLSLRHTLSHGVGLDAGLEDLLTALRWAQENGVTYGSAERLAAVGGAGLGGNLAAVTCQLLKSMGERQPELQLLLYPALDLASETASATAYADAAVLSPALQAWREGRLIGPEASPLDPRVSPLRAHDLSGLAPCVLVAAGFDPLLDDGEAYARRLRAAGVKVRYRCHDTLPHGFAAFTGASPAAEAACREAAQMAADALGRGRGSAEGGPVTDLLGAVDEGWSWKGLFAAEIVDRNDFGNLIVRDRSGQFWRICPEDCRAEPIADSEAKYRQVRADPAFVLDWEMTALVQAAAERLGPAGEGRCYCLMMPSVLGGAYTADNLGTIGIVELISFTGDLARQIEDLPDGASVEIQIVD